MTERLAIAGSGTIACGLAAAASRHGEVVVVARSAASAERARGTVRKLCGRLSGEVNADRVRVEDDLGALGDATFVVEAVAEDLEAKSALLAGVAANAGATAVLASTTSSLPVAALAAATGAPERFAALHVFNPVPKMALVEIAFATEATEDTRGRTRELCLALGKTPVEVPDSPGFVVNRLLFPFLFSAVELMERSGLEPVAVDTCMKLGAAHPMGPLELLDFVGLDVAVAIGDAIGVEVPGRLRTLVAEGALGRKAGRGLHAYPT